MVWMAVLNLGEGRAKGEKTIAPSGNIETLSFTSVIDTFCDLLQEIGPTSVIFKATSVLLSAPASGGDTWFSGPAVWRGGISTGVGLASNRAGHLHLCWVVLCLQSSLGRVWYLAGSKSQLISHVCWMSELGKAVLCKSCVFTKLRVVSHGLRYNVRTCGSVWRGMLFWSTLVGPAWCRRVRMAFGEGSLELYFGRKVGLFSEERGSKLTSLQSRWPRNQDLGMN